MDKYEYKVRADEINRLIGEGDYAQAADIADTIDWRRVKSVMMLCTVSDLYKINRRYEDAKNMLLLAYERRPGGRTICYSLCELCIKTEDFLQAVNYYKEFVHTAPKDPGRYILQYKIYEAQDVSLEERIGVLEELKKRDYREKWAYELAYLYHRVGLATRCVEECDELILWFGSGKYVVKAMELKMLHEPLTAAQQEAYDHRFDTDEQEDGYQSDVREDSGSQEGEGREEEPGGQEEYGQYDQPEEETFPGEDGYGRSAYREYEGGDSETDGGFGEAEALSEESEELDIQVKTMDVGKFNTINLQEELAAGLQEVLGAEYGEDLGNETGNGEEQSAEYGRADLLPEEREEIREEILEEMPEVEEDVEVFFGETGELRNVPEDTLSEEALEERGRDRREPEETAAEISGPDGTDGPAAQEDGSAEDSVRVETGELVMRRMREEAVGTEKEKADSLKVEPVQPPAELAGVLSQEANGQIRLVVPERTAVEKQITGQMKIEDILAEWERMKKESQEKGREEVRRHVLQQTGPMFTEFEAAIRDGLLEQLETGENAGEEQPEEADLPEEFSDGAESGEVPEPEEEDRMDYPDREEGFPEEEDRTDYPDREEGFSEEEEGTADYPDREEAFSDPEDVRDLEEQDFRENEEEFTDFGESDGYFTVADDEMPADELPEGERYRELSYEEPAEAEDLGAEEVPEDYNYYSEEEEYAGDEEAASEAYEYAVNPHSEEYPAYYEEDGESYEGESEEASLAAEEPDTEEGVPVFPESLSEDIAVSEESGDENEEDDEIDTEPEQKAGRKKLRKALKAGAGKKKGGDSKTREEDTAAGAGTPEEPEEEKEEKRPIERDRAKIRGLTREEKELYAPFIQSRRSREQLVKAIDNISMAAYTGNIVITGEEGMDTLTLAKNMIREVQMADSNFSGKAAKISGQDLNKRDVRKTLEELNGGALIIYTASGMNTDTARALYRSLQQERLGIIVVLEDTKKAIQKLFLGTPELTGAFTAKMDVEALSNDTLVLFGKRYAREMEYSIDDLGILALHTRIEELQTIDHVVTVVDVKKIVDEAIRHAGRKTLGHFFDILFARRYDDEDMIILTEKDFVA